MLILLTIAPEIAISTREVDVFGRQVVSSLNRKRIFQVNQNK